MRSAESAGQPGPAVPAPLPPVRYDQLHGLGPRALWRPLVGVVLLVGLLLAAQLLLTAVFSTALYAGGLDLSEIADRLGGDPVTPTFLALVNLGWAAAIPAVWLVARVLHGQSPGWTASVVRRIRWGWLLACLGLSVVALALTLVVAAFLPEQGAGSVEVDGTLNAWTSTTRDFLLVVLLLTPLQAAGEEYAFRGYLTQACGGVAGRFGDRIGAGVAVVVPALLFAVAHGAGQDAPVFFDRFAFGLVAGLLVVLTGGLEAGIAMHVLNNFLAYALALAFGDMTEALNPGDASWWSVPVTLTQSVTFLVLTVLVARGLGVAGRTGQGILEPRRPPV
ncbi:lysostaphin resistance A-like protein [Nocardioides sp. SYSU DS0651]|uniref:CPBP family intramembrane glutamic endopeptidase n=1 Tax=Nocardioides sp. SYSU DS0651 TaxID=3415955 RepID=UPI003F4BE480